MAPVPSPVLTREQLVSECWILPDRTVSSHPGGQQAGQVLQAMGEALPRSLPRRGPQIG